MLNIFFNFINCKKGQGLPIETVIIIILLIVVLIVVLLIFSEQSGSIFDTVAQFLGIASDSTPKNLTEIVK